MQQSRMFNYVHEVLPQVAVLIIFAAFYVTRRREIQTALRGRTFWVEPIYAVLVFVLPLVYLGLQYTYSGFTKLLLGGFDAGSGLCLQLLYAGREDLPPLAVPIVRYRLLATFSMTLTVILETAAILAFLIPRIRPWWAFGLMSMHTIVLLTMAIPFKTHMIILAWIIAYNLPMLRASADRLLQHVRVVDVSSAQQAWRRPLVDTIYAIDVFRILRFQESSPTVSKC